MRHETAIFGQKTQIQKFQLSFVFLPFFLFQKQKTKICWNPYFYSVLANLKKDNFPKIKLKTQKFEKPKFCTLFSKKAIFR